MLRFAASTTKDMDLDDLKIAIFNYIIAKQQNKEFIVRIEDMDIQNNIEGKDGEILAILEKFGLNEDQLYYQSKNKHIHQHMALKLIEQKKAFACFCSQKEVAAQKALAKDKNSTYSYSGKCEFLTQQQILKSDKKYVVRIKKPQSDIVLEDLLTKDISIPPAKIDSFVILQSDATPTEDFASAVDDMIQGVSFICQKNTIDQSAKQLHIRKMFDYEKTTRYLHLPAIKNSENITIKWLLSEGFLPDAIINYLLLLGNETPTDIFDMHEAIKWFDITKLSTTPAAFDLQKLRYLNIAHIKKTPPRKLSKYFGFSDAMIGELAKLYTQEGATLKEIDARITAIFRPKNFDNDYKEQMQLLQKIILQAALFEEFNEFKAYLLAQSYLDEKELLRVLQLLLTAQQTGPKLDQLYPYLKGYLTQIVR